MKPHVIYLDIKPELAAERMVARGRQTDNVEALGIEHQRKVAANFEALFDDCDNDSLYHSVWFVNANADLNTVETDLETIIKEIKDDMSAKH